MAPSEAALARHLEEIESELESLRNAGKLYLRAAESGSPIRSKISFVKSLIAAESAGQTPDRLNPFVAQLFALESQLSALEPALDEAGEVEEAVEQKKKTMAMEGTEYPLLRRELEDLEAMAHAMPLEFPSPFWSPNAAKLRSKIRWAKSRLSAEDKDEQLASMTARLAAVEGSFARWVESRPLSCSCTSSCYTEDLEEEEDEVDGDGGILQTIDSLRSNLVVIPMEMQSGNDEEEENIESQFIGRIEAIAVNESSPCVCTSSCFEEEEEGEKKQEVDVYSSSGANDTEQYSLLTKEEEVEGKSEAVFSLQETREGSLKANGNGERSKFGKLRAIVAMAGVFCVAVAGIVFQNFFSEQQPVYLVPT